LIFARAIVDLFDRKRDIHVIIMAESVTGTPLRGELLAAMFWECVSEKWRR
jgi:hypothetical protein